MDQIALNLTLAVTGRHLTKEVEKHRSVIVLKDNLIVDNCHLTDKVQSSPLLTII